LLVLAIPFACMFMYVLQMEPCISEGLVAAHLCKLCHSGSI